LLHRVHRVMLARITENPKPPFRISLHCFGGIYYTKRLLFQSTRMHVLGGSPPLLDQIVISCDLVTSSPMQLIWDSWFLLISQ
jgi:hypothetical protein